MPNSYIEALNVTTFGKSTFTQVTEVRWGQKDLCPRKKKKKHQGYMCTEKRLCSSKRRPYISEGEGPQEKSNLVAHWIWPPSLQNCDKVNFCYLSYPGCGIFKWQSYQTDMSGKNLKVPGASILFMLGCCPVSMKFQGSTWEEIFITVSGKKVMKDMVGHLTYPTKPKSLQIVILPIKTSLLPGMGFKKPKGEI